MESPLYPLVPKSTRSLLRGQFWALPLGGSTFGAACVVGSHTNSGKVSQRMFIAGVVRWTGKSLPTAYELEGVPIVEFAFVHLKAITESGGALLGQVKFQFDHAPQSAEALSLGTWGYQVPIAIARRLAQNAA